ncbi:lysozyme, partial [Cellulophaga sp. BC115SP]|uniref:lysozyme n=1 Tax=Cellulophaga sp. BC115SP TaxID=2683263 RepID=UPI001412E85F
IEVDPQSKQKASTGIDFSVPNSSNIVLSINVLDEEKKVEKIEAVWKYLSGGNVGQDISDNGKMSLAKQEGGCILHVYNDYKGGRSNYCTEHFDGSTVKAGHKDNAQWTTLKCEAQNHYAEIERINLKGYGNPTIGIGYMIPNHAELTNYCITKNNGITEDECLSLFSLKLPSYVNDLKSALPEGSQLTQCQFDALVSIVYNRGITAFKKDELYKNYISKKKFNDPGIRDKIINDSSKLSGSDRRIAEANLYQNCTY